MCPTSSIETMAEPTIFVAMPNLGELATGHTSNLIAWFMSGKYRLTWFPLMGKAPLDRARNECHQAFIAKPHDYLLFMDSDTVPPVDVIDQLLEADKDMISATVQTLQRHFNKPKLVPVAFRWNVDDPDDIGYKAYWGEGIERVDVTTLACTLIKREVLEAVGKRAFQYVYDPDSEWGIEGWSEDFFFSRLVGEKGFEIYNHYGVLCDHYKTFSTKTVNELMLNAHLKGATDG